MKCQFKIGDYVTYNDGYEVTYECQIIFIDEADERKPYWLAFISSSNGSLPDWPLMEVSYFVGREELHQCQREALGKHCGWAKQSELTLSPRLFTLDYIINILYHEIK